jgi:hypothetical protein
VERPRIATLALTLLLVVPPAALSTVSASPADGTAATEAAPGLTTSGTPPAVDASPSTLLRGLYGSADVDTARSEPLTMPSGDRPLVAALDHLAEARGEPVDDAALGQAKRDAADLPPDLRAALALVVEANAVATERARQDGAAHERADAARDALLVARAVDAALPTLRKYSLFYASDAGALRVEQARTVDAVVALATGSQPLAPSEAGDDLPDAVLDVYDQVGVEATPTDLDRMDAGAAALPDDVRRAATVLTRGQARSMELRSQAFESADADDFAALADEGLQSSLASEGDAEARTDAQRWVDSAAGVDAAKLRQAELAAVTAALQANAILEGEDRQPVEEDRGILDTVWDGVTKLVDTLNPLGVASAQVGAQSCPTGSPLADCSNDVWFTDPFGIVVVSGPGTSVYDARYGQASLENATSSTLRRLPTDGVEVTSRSVVGGTGVTVRGSLPREVAENTTRQGAVRGIDEAALRRPFYVASLDLGGDDLYTHHTGSTLGLDPGDVETDEIPLLASALVDAGGDDTYDPTQAQRTDGTIANATLGGLGVLLDTAGDDTYEGGNHSIATASLLGRSALLDLDGEDEYRAGTGSVGAAQTLGSSILVDDCAAPLGERCTGGNDTVATGSRSQGWATTGGVAAYVNKGGSDTYRRSAGPAQGEARTFGVSVFADVGGGNDTGIRPGADGDDVQGLESTPWTAEVVARPNDRPVEARIWADNATAGGGAGVAADITTPAALELNPEGGGVIASFERASVPGVELPGLFFLDGASDTVYNQDYALTVDLSGFDTYENNAGGALDLSEGSSGQGVTGTALALDLAGNDRYDPTASSTSTWGVQGAARGGAGLLLDLGRSSDTYEAGDRAQGAAADDGVGLLIDDGSIEGRDRFQAGDASQGSADRNGLGALLTLDGDTTYEAGSTSQGFGADGGVGLLVDRRLDRRTGKVDLDGLPTADPSGDDAFRADELAQGAALDGGTGILADTGGDDEHVVTDRGQGYASPELLEDASGSTTPNGSSSPTTSQALLVDLTGRDTYRANADPAQAHGFADPDASARSRALLADFALPRVPLLAPDNVVGPIRESILGGSEISLPGSQALPAWDPTDFYDDWLREGRGDSYVPDTTPSDQEKEENAYWEQPESSVRAGSGTRANDTSAGLGMDNPPIAAPKAGADRFFAAAEIVQDFYATTHEDAFEAARGSATDGNLTSAALRTAEENTTLIDLRDLVVQNTKPTADLNVSGADPSGCNDEIVNRTLPANGRACFTVRVDQVAGITGDPDRNMEVTLQVRPEGNDTWITVGKARSQSYYEAAKDTFENAGFGTVEDLAQIGSINIDPSGNPAVPTGSTSAVVEFIFEAARLCSETNGTGVDCPGEDAPPTVPDAAAWPDGRYEVRAEVETITATLTAGRSTASDRADMSIENDPQLLGVDVTHPNSETEEPGNLTLYTTDPHRGYEVRITGPEGRHVDTVGEHRSSGGIGTPVQDAYDGTPTEGRTVYETTAGWPDDDDDRFPEPGRYQYEAVVNQYDRPFNVTQRLSDLSGDADRTPLTPSFDDRVTNASAVSRGVYSLVIGGEDGDGIRDTIMRLDRPREGNDYTAILDENFETLDPAAPVADAATVRTNNAIYLFGGRTPDGPTDQVVKITGANSNDPTIQVLEASLPTPLWDATAVPGGSDGEADRSDRIYVFGGHDADGLRDDILTFDLPSESFDTNETEDMALPSPRASMGGHWTGTDQQAAAYLFGGVSPGGAVDQIIRFDPNAESDPRVDANRAPAQELNSPTLETTVADPVVYPTPDEDRKALVLGGVTEEGQRADILTYDANSQELSRLDVAVPRFRADTLVAQKHSTSDDSPMDAFYVMGAGLFQPSRTYDGNVSADGTSPTVELVRPSGPIGTSPRCPDDAVAIPAEATDGESGVTAIHLELAHREDPAPIRTTADTAPSLSGTRCLTVQEGATLSVGAVAVDGAGNEAPAANASYRVDLTPPNATTTIPHPPAETDAGVAIVNDTSFAVGWEGVSADTTELHVQYRVLGEHDGFQDGPTVDSPGRDGSATLPAGDLAPKLVAHGTALEVRVQAEDRAGNLQEASDLDAEQVRLDLLGPEIQDLDVAPDFQKVRVAWNLSETGVRHTLDVDGPDGFEEHRTFQRTHDHVVRVVGGLDDGTPYDLTVASFDEAGNRDAITVNFTTEASLTLDWQTPEAGAILSDEAPVRFLVGSSSEGTQQATMALVATGPDDRSEALARNLPFEVTGSTSNPAPPSINPYPVDVGLDDAPEGQEVKLKLGVSDDVGSTSATRTVTIDRSPPTVPGNASATLQGPQGPSTGKVPWFRGPVNVTSVPATDAVTGVNRTEYAWTDGPLNRTFDPDDPPTRAGQGLHTFRHRSVDEAGNAEPDVNKRYFGIDLDAPQVNASVAGNRTAGERNVTLSVEARDALSTVAHVRTHLADEPAPDWSDLDASTLSPTVTLPDDDGRHTVTVSARDQAGNVAHENVTVVLSTRPPKLTEGPSAVPLSPVAAEVTWTTDKPSQTLLEVPNAPADMMVRTTGFTTDHAVVVQELEPGADVTSEVTLVDRAGHETESVRLNVTTPTDDSPPTAPANLTAVDTGRGTVVLGWSPSRDVSGIDRYVVERARSDATRFEQVANLTSTPYVDRDVTIGETYEYRVHAIDNAGEAGPVANASASPSEPPTIRNATVDLAEDNGTPVLVLEATVVAGGEPVTSVDAVVAGTDVPLAAAEGTPKGTLYRATVNATSLPVEDGVDVAFTATDGDLVVRDPEDGFRTVTPAGASGSGGDSQDIPAPDLWTVLAAAGAALALRRRGTGGCPPG